MKELSVEEKAKAYDEALKRAIAAHKDEDRHLKATLERIFPELKESEDEKIRKVLKHYLEVRRCQTQSDEEYINCNNFLAWLEKQGKVVNEICKENDDSLINEDEKIRKELIGYIVKEVGLYPGEDRKEHKWLRWLEKQGEHKPNANCLLRWSKEDKKMFQSLEDIVGDYWAKAEQEKNEIKIRETSDVSYFLKTIQKSPLCWIKCSDGLPNKDGTYLVVTDGTHNDVYDLARYDSIDGWHKASEIIYWMPIPQLNNKSIIEQKSAEWSEEDEEMFEYTINLLNYNLGCRKWLKSLKDRYTWKPSDAQIRALEYIINNASNTSYSCKIAKGLLEQLKKLKGE